MQIVEGLIKPSENPSLEVSPGKCVSFIQSFILQSSHLIFSSRFLHNQAVVLDNLLRVHRVNGIDMDLKLTISHGWSALNSFKTTFDYEISRLR